MERDVPSSTDYLIVGLGVCGLSSAYHLAKAGKGAVLGLDQYADSGMQGTSSAGYTKSYREDASITEFRECAKYNLQIWTKFQDEFSRPILKEVENLRVGLPKNPEIQNVLQRLPKGTHVMTKEQLEKKYPLFKVREGEIGLWSWDAAVTNVKNALHCFKQSAIKEGASLFYGCEVTKIDIELQEVQFLRNGKSSSIRYKTLVMSCGPYTERFKVMPNVEVIQTETIALKNVSGIPLQGVYQGEQSFYFLPNDFDITELKLGLFQQKSLKKIVQIVKQRYPSLLSSLGEANPCFFTQVTPTTGLNIYREGNVIWAYGQSGFGFKHGPSMRRKVLRLIEGASPKL